MKFIGKNNNIIFQQKNSCYKIPEIYSYRLNIFKFSWSIQDNCMFRQGWSRRIGNLGRGYYVRYGGNNIGPFIGGWVTDKKKMSYKDRINIDLLYDIKKVEISLQVDEK